MKNENFHQEVPKYVDPKTEQFTNYADESGISKNIYDKFGIPHEDVDYIPDIDIKHDQVLSSVINDIKPVNFAELAQLDQGERITAKHVHVLVVEEVLKVVKDRKWSLCIHNGSIFVYNAAYWKGISREPLRVFLGLSAENLGVDRYDARHFTFRDALLKQFFSSAYLPKPEKNRNEIYINFQNGTFVVSPKEQYLRGFRKEDFLTYQLPFRFDPDADCPQFQIYLDRVLPDRTQQAVLAEYIAYVLVPNSVLSLEKALVLIGNGANGKSVFFSIVCALLGAENVTNFGLESLTDSKGYHRAKLANVLLNYASEISPSMDSTIFKQLVSGEPVEARAPYQEPFILSDYARFIFNTNNLPRDVEQNEAFFRRFILVYFGVTIPPNERDPELAKKINSSELPGVFNWVLEGLGRLLKNKGFTPSTAIENAIKDYRKQSDSVQLFLEDGGYQLGNEKEVHVKIIYLEYKEYCADFGYKACSLKSFTERLRSLGGTVTRHAKGNLIGLKK